MTKEQKFKAMIFAAAALFAFVYFILGSTAIVSAETYSTCARTCTEYISSECGAQCGEGCVPSTVSGVPECALGMCFDPNEGTCQQGAPKRLCENNGGIWDTNPNSQKCRLGCCIVGEESFLATDTQCTKISTELGKDKNYKIDANTPVKCDAFSNTKEEGACLLGEDRFTGKRECKFITKSSCASLRGEFYGGFLCSYPDFNTTCEKQKTSRCVENKDEIYWFDSCGNRENIYDANRAKSWNNGKVLSKNESCSLASGNRGTCGNCEYISGSKCGNKTATQKLDDDAQKNVCRDLSCVDEEGNRRAHGESWCVYQSNIGIDSSGGDRTKEGYNSRAIDTVGSRHYRKLCWEGELRLEPCAERREEICIENTTSKSAVCLPNEWRACIGAGGDESDCNQHALFCYSKVVYVDSNFQFDQCVPRYPPGTSSECDRGTETCEVIYQKGWGWDADWKCKWNCDCLSRQFSEKMNDLCMSLGDCGAETNYIGKLTKNIDVSGKGGRGKKPSEGYYKGLMEFYKPIDGKFIDGTTHSSSGINAHVNDVGEGEAENNEQLGKTSGSNFFSRIVNWFGDLLGFGPDHKHRYVKFGCYSWQPPSGGDSCEKCGADGFPCTEYACGSLGQTCKFINANSGGNERCIDFNPYGTSPPLISPWINSVEEGFKFGSSTATGVTFESTDEDGCVRAGPMSIVKIGISTNMPSMCKYSTVSNFNYSEGADVSYDPDNDSAFDEGDFGENIIIENRSNRFFIPSMENLGSTSNDPNARVNYNLYVKCKSPAGIVNLADYNIKMCVKRGVDLMAPGINKVSPENGFVRYGSAGKSIDIYTNEPADCRWSLNDNVYNSMKGNFSCDNAPQKEMPYGWRCNATLPIGENQTTYFVRCKDQPWEENESKRNPMTASYPIVLKPTSELKITSLYPDNELLTFGVIPATVILKAETEGGADNAAQCYFSMGDGVYHPFNMDRWAQTHENKFNSIPEGTSNFEIKCADEAGNEVYQNISFEVKLDISAPKIVRVYQLSGNLIIITDEDAECAISPNSCAFNYENATQMMGGKRYHSVPIALKTNYYIMCKDVFENNKGECDLKIKTI